MFNHNGRSVPCLSIAFAYKWTNLLSHKCNITCDTPPIILHSAFKTFSDGEGGGSRGVGVIWIRSALAGWMNRLLGFTGSRGALHSIPLQGNLGKKLAPYFNLCHIWMLTLMMVEMTALNVCPMGKWLSWCFSGGFYSHIRALETFKTWPLLSIFTSSWDSCIFKIENHADLHNLVNWY